MDVTRFTNQATGRIAPVNILGRKDWAFIPNLMPPAWAFDSSLWPLLVDAKEAVRTLNGIGCTLPNPRLLLRPLQNTEALASSRIEGTYVTPAQLLLYELDPRESRAPSEREADWHEVFNCARALQTGQERLRTLPLCNRIILEMHSILMGGVRGRDKAPGEFRKRQVLLGSSGRFIPPPASEVAGLMDNLEKYMNSESKGYDPLVAAYILHYQFETIHPFEDGNGRVRRALLALTIYKWLGHTMPWLYMSAYFDRFKDEYIDNLLAISADGEWTRWVEFCLRGTIAQATDSITRCGRLQEVRHQFKDRLTSSSPRTHPIIESLFDSPVVTVASLARAFDVNYKTAKADVDKLVEAKILAEIPNHYPKSFYAPEIMAIAYDLPTGASGREGELSPSQDTPAHQQAPPSEQTLPAARESGKPSKPALP